LLADAPRALAGGPVALARSRFDATLREHVQARNLVAIAPRLDGLGFRVPAEYVIVMRSGRKAKPALARRAAPLPPQGGGSPIPAYWRKFKTAMQRLLSVATTSSKFRYWRQRCPTIGSRPRALAKTTSELVLLFTLNEGVAPAFQNAGHLIPNHRNVN